MTKRETIDEGLEGAAEMFRESPGSAAVTNAALLMIAAILRAGLPPEGGEAGNNGFRPWEPPAA